MLCFAVGNLSFDSTEAELQQVLMKVGPIKNLR
jgi:RNA recognition motif-containing protein